MEKFMLPRKMLNIIYFARLSIMLNMLKKSPNLSPHMLINVMIIKKHASCLMKV